MAWTRPCILKSRSAALPEKEGGPGPIIFTNPQNFYHDPGRFPWKPGDLTWPANGRDVDNDSLCLLPGLPAVLYKSLSSKSLQLLEGLKGQRGLLCVHHM